jgi:hypothetical protein
MAEVSGDSLSQSAVERLESAAQHVDIDAEALEQLRHPKTVVEVFILLDRDEGNPMGHAGRRIDRPGGLGLSAPRQLLGPRPEKVVTFFPCSLGPSAP